MNFISKRFLEFYKLNPIKMNLNILLALTFPIDDFVIPYFTKEIVNNVTNKKPWINQLIILIIILLIMKVIVSLSSLQDADVLPKMQNFIKHEMISDMLKRFENSHVEPIIGEIMSRFVKIPIVFTHLYEDFKNYILAYFISFFITAAYIISLDRSIGFVVLASVMFVFSIIIFSPATCIKQTNNQDNSLSKIDEETEDILRNISSIYISDQVKNELSRLKEYEIKYEKNFMTTTACTIKTRTVAIIILAAMMSFFAYKSYKGINDKSLSVGAFVAILIILSNWFNTLGWLIDNIKDIVMNWGIIDAYEKMLNSQITAPINKPIIINPNPPSSGLYFDNIKYAIPGNSKIIIDGLSLYIKEKEKVAIVGEIGSGKSTLVKLLLGLREPISGDIYIDGVAISRMTKSILRKTITYVSQNPILFNRSVIENITYGLVNKPDVNYVRSLINELGLSENLNDLNKIAGKNGNALSGGQKQIIAILRAFLMNPKIIALDEVTSSIDLITKKKLLDLISTVFKDKTVIIITHDPELMKLAKRVCKIQDGKITCSLSA
jgi:ATP-binding cassette subfamily B protein